MSPAPVSWLIADFSTFPCVHYHLPWPLPMFQHPKSPVCIQFSYPGLCTCPSIFKHSSLYIIFIPRFLYMLASIWNLLSLFSACEFPSIQWIRCKVYTIPFLSHLQLLTPLCFLPIPTWHVTVNKLITVSGDSLPSSWACNRRSVCVWISGLNVLFPPPSQLVNRPFEFSVVVNITWGGKGLF